MSSESDRPHPNPDSERGSRAPTRLGRREFLRRSAATTVALGTAWSASNARGEAADAPSVRRYAPLGKTGLEISDISFGSSRMSDPAVVRHAFERGINYFDTAEGYKGGASEEAIGRALSGERERIILASKQITRTSETAADFMRSLEGSLRRLRTDRIDIYFNHAINDLNRLKHEPWYEFLDRAKQQGKIRFTGISGHGGYLSRCLEYVTERELVDVVLVAYNFGEDPSLLDRLTRGMDFVALQPELPARIEAAQRKGIGVIAMKTLMGARLNDMRRYERDGGTFAQAAFRWVLSSPHVDALIVSMNSAPRIDEYLGASGARSAKPEDAALLGRYLALHSDTYCRQGCGQCLASCPHGVEIDEVLRTRMYASHYGDLSLARDGYATLGTDAAACASCVGMPCAGQCPHGIPIPELTRSAHRKLG